METCMDALILRVHAYMDVSSRATHDYMDIGGRVTPGAVTEEAKAEDGYCLSWRILAIPRHSLQSPTNRFSNNPMSKL